jgi:hypothetical protein
VSEALRNLPVSEKIQLNAQIKGRNTIRALKRAQHAQNPTRYPEDASDNESVVTISEEDAISPASRLHASIQSLSQASGKQIIRLLQQNGPKRAREDDERRPEARQVAKRI